MDVVVARIGRAHGLRGEVTVEVRTDDPAARLEPGAVLATDPAGAGPLTVRTARDHNGVLLLAFDGVPDRTAAEALRGVLLLAEEDEDEDDAWYERDLVGLAAVDAAGTALGRVVRLEHLPAQDLLVVERPDGQERLVPFVAAIVPVVDVAGGRVVLDPPPGLLEDLPDDDGDGHHDGQDDGEDDGTA